MLSIGCWIQVQIKPTKLFKKIVKIGTDKSTTNEMNSEVVVKKFDPDLNCGESEDLIKSVECKRKIKRPDVVVPESPVRFYFMERRR